MSGSMVTVDLSSFDAMIDGLVSEVQQAARPAAQAGAQVLYDDVQSRVARIKRYTGNLASSIYQAYATHESSPGRAVYQVSWNPRKAPHGHLVEYGHLMRYEVTRTARGFKTHKDRPLTPPVQVPAKPFMRPVMTKFPVAEEAMRTRFIAELVERGVLK